jgi:hypothetical protein
LTGIISKSRLSQSRVFSISTSSVRLTGISLSSSAMRNIRRKSYMTPRAWAPVPLGADRKSVACPAFPPLPNELTVLACRSFGAFRNGSSRRLCCRYHWRSLSAPRRSPHPGRSPTAVDRSRPSSKWIAGKITQHASGIALSSRGRPPLRRDHARVLAAWPLALCRSNSKQE